MIKQSPHKATAVSIAQDMLLKGETLTVRLVHTRLLRHEPMRVSPADVKRWLVSAGLLIPKSKSEQDAKRNKLRFEIMMQYLDGMDVAAIASKLEVKVQYVNDTLRKFGLRKFSYGGDRVAHKYGAYRREVFTLAEQGLSCAEIERIMKGKFTRVRDWYNRYHSK